MVHIKSISLELDKQSCTSQNSFKLMFDILLKKPVLIFFKYCPVQPGWIWERNLENEFGKGW